MVARIDAASGRLADWIAATVQMSGERTARDANTELAGASMASCSRGGPTILSAVMPLLATDLSGIPAGVPLFSQYWINDPGGVAGFASSNAVTPKSL